MRVFPAPERTPLIDLATKEATVPWSRFFKAIGDQAVAANSKKGDAAMRHSVHGCLVWVQIPAAGVLRTIELPKVPDSDGFLPGMSGITVTTIPLYEGQKTVSVPSGVQVFGAYFFKEEI